MGFHQILQGGEIGVKLSPGCSHEERLRQLEEAARFAHQRSGDACAAVNTLKGHGAFHWERPRYAFRRDSSVRLVLGDLGLTFDPPTERLSDSAVARAHANGPWRCY